MRFKKKTIAVILIVFLLIVLILILRQADRKEETSDSPADFDLFLPGAEEEQEAEGRPEDQANREDKEDEESEEERIISNWQWLEEQNKLYNASPAEVDLILGKLREYFPDRPARLKALSLLRLGTPYQMGCLGEGFGRDSDPLFRLDVTDCTAFVLTNAALLSAENINQAEENMKKANYRDQTVSFENRLHFTIDRNRTSPYFSLVTDLIFPDKAEKELVVLNKAGDSGRLIDIDWEKEILISFIPSRYINQSFLDALPQSLGIAFVRKEMFEKGLDVVHEGLLFDNQDFIHASSVRGRVVKENFLDYYWKDKEPLFDGVILFTIN